MLRWFTLSVLIILFSTPVFGDSNEDMSAALALFPAGQDVAVTLSDDGRIALESAIKVLEAAVGVTLMFDHTDEAAYMDLNIDLDKKPLINALSQGYYTWGDVFLSDTQAKETAFMRGQYWGLKSLRMTSEFAVAELRHGFIEAVNLATDVTALFWTFSNWSRRAGFELVASFARNDPPKLEALINRVFEIDSSYMNFAPYRALASFWGGLPPIPLIPFRQNLPRVLSYICAVINEPQFCQDCRHCPVSDDVDEYFENRLIFVQYYLMEKELWDAAARVLQSILDAPIGERFMLYNAHCVRRARVLLEEINERR